jgi:glycosyltransferase involved in cell wall biosynthesis
MAASTPVPEVAGAERGSGRAPAVSVGLPVFNAGRYLEEALSSLLAQTFSDFELVVSDNGSTDRTREICESYAARDERIRYLRGEVNRGASWNFNQVFLQSRAPYFRWASYDDLCAPTHLERCVEVLSQAPPAVVLCYTKTRFIAADGSPLHDHEDNLDLRGASPTARLRKLVRNISWANVQYGLIRTEALSKTRLLGSYASSDYVLLAELALLGEFWEIPEVLFLRREHEKMSTKANVTSGELSAWLDPSAKRPTNHELWKLFEQHLAAISHSPLAPGAKAAAYAGFLPAWLRSRGKGMVREVLPPAIVRWLRPGSSPAPV